MRIRPFVIALALVLTTIFAGVILPQGQPTAPPRAVSINGAETIDVNDISVLWPAPSNQKDVNALISLSDLLADGKSPILAKAAFATTVSVNDSAGRPNPIDFSQFAEQFRQPSNWKIAAIRIDPSAPGTSPELIKTVGSIPQIRLIAQPVTMDGNNVIIHDTTAHIVFSFVTNAAPPFQPDKKKFAEIESDVRAVTFNALRILEKSDSSASSRPAHCTRFGRRGFVDSKRVPGDRRSRSGNVIATGTKRSPVTGVRLDGED